MFIQVLKFELYFVELKCNDNWYEEPLVEAKKMFEGDNISKD